MEQQTRRSDVPGTIYLIHFDKPYKHIQHYLGWTEGPVEHRIQRHRIDSGSPLMQAVVKTGISWSVVRTWPDETRREERRLHLRGPGKFCPVCDKGRRYTYETCSADYSNPGDAINEMVDAAVETTYKAFLHRCDGVPEFARSKGYVRDCRTGLTLQTDQYVTFHRSTVYGKRCYYLVWSAIKYIWLRNGDGVGWGY